MTAITFDTLIYSKKLREAGIPEKAAEIQAETLKEVIENTYKDIEAGLATKKDLKDSENTLLKEIKATEAVLRNELELKIAQVKAELVKWVLGVSVAQAAIIVSCIKLIH